MFNSIYKKLKLYRFSTVLKYLGNSWEYSAFIKEKNPSKSRLIIAWDLVYCFVFYGHDFNDYCTFEFWKKQNSERKTYISYKRNDRLRFAFTSPKAYELFLDKAAFNMRFKKYVKRGWLVSTGKEWHEIESFVLHYDSVIAKPLKDYGGHGVIKIKKDGNDYSSKMTMLKSELDGGKDYIIEQTLHNCEELRILAPGSLNTIRIVTVIDREKKLHVIASLLRMGNGTASTDNYHDGGMACVLDLKNGQLKGNAKGMRCVEYKKHPYSHIKFDGYKIPHINDILTTIKEIAFYEPDARYVGWDVALTPFGIEILEGNIPPGEDITQIATGRGIWYDMLNWK